MREKYSQKSQIKYGAIISYACIAFTILAGLIYTPWMIKQIGKSQYGLYTLANSLITLFLVDFGLSSATARYVSKYHAEGNEIQVKNFLGTIYRLYLIIDAVIFAALTVVFFFLESIYVKLTPSELAQFKVVYIIAGLFNVVNFPFVTLNGILTAYEKFIQLKLIDLIQKVLVVVLMIIALLAGYGLYALVLVNALAGIIAIILKLAAIKRETDVSVNFSYSEKSLSKDIFSFSIWAAVATLAQRLIFNITPTILGIVSNTAAIAVFGIVITIEGYAYTITGAINGMFMPKISRIYAEGNGSSEVMPLMISVGRFQYALNGLIIAGFAIIGKNFITLWMSPDYIDAYYGLLLVMIPGIFYNSMQIANTTMVVTKNVDLQAKVNVIMGAVNVALSFILSKRYGVIGASTSIFVAYMIRAVGLNVLYYKKLKIDIPLFIKKCYLKMSAPIIATLLVGFPVCRAIKLGGWLGLALQGLAVVVIYLLMLVLLGLTATERKYVLNKFGIHGEA